MAFLRTVSAIGTVFLGEADRGPASYNLDIHEENGWKRAVGTLRADPAVLGASFKSADHLVIRLADGAEVRLIVNRWTPGEDIAEITASGPVPEI